MKISSTQKNKTPMILDQTGKAKLASTLSLVIVAIFVLVVVWRFDQSSTQSKVAWAESKMRAQVGSFVSAIQAELKLTQQAVIPAFAHLEANRQGNVPFARWGNVAGVGLLTLTSDAPILEAVQMASPDISEELSLEAVKLAVEKIKSQEIRNGATPVIGFASDKGQKYIGVVFPLLVKWTSAANVVASTAALGIMKSEVFQALMDRQNAFTEKAILLNEDGFAVGHHVAEYSGIKVNDPSLTKLFQDGRLLVGPVARLDLPQGEILSVQEQVPKSNLVVVLQTPMNQVMQGRWQALVQFLVLGVGCIMLLIVVNRRRTEEEHEGFVPVGLAENKAVVPEVNDTLVAPKQMTTKPSYETSDRGLGNRRLVANLTHEISAPLSTILGHVHLAQRTESVEKMRTHLESIETEVRKSRSFIEKLNDYSGEKQHQPEKLDLELVLTTFFDKMKPLFQKENIKLHLPEVKGVYIRSSKENFEKVLHVLVQNSVEAMRGVSSKNLSIVVNTEKFMVEIQVQDTGEGISPENLPKIANPFFTTRSPALHLGLGLSVVSGVVREHQAEFRVESELRKGTTVFLRWPIFEEQVVALPEVVSNSEVPSEEVIPPSTNNQDIFGENLMDDLQEQFKLSPTEAALPPVAEALSAEEVFAKQVDELLELPPLPEQVNSLVQDLKTAIVDAAEQTPPEDDVPAELSPVEVPPVEPPPAEPTFKLTDEFEKTMVVENIDGNPAEEIGQVSPPEMAVMPSGVGFKLPSVKVNKKASKLADYQVKVRRPGEKLT